MEIIKLKVYTLLFVTFYNHNVVCVEQLGMLGLQSITGDAWSGGWPCHMAVEMALEGINNHPDVLDGYRLWYEYVDDEVRHWVTHICMAIKTRVNSHR